MRYRAEFTDTTGRVDSTLETNDLGDIILRCIDCKYRARVYRCRVPEEWGTQYLHLDIHWSGKVIVANR